MIVGIDPGNAAPGYCVLTSSGTIAYAGVTLPDLFPVDAVAVEGQWTSGRGGGRRIGVMSMAALAFDAGLRLGLVPAQRRFKLPPKVWRDVLWTGGGALPKSVVVARLRRDVPGVDAAWTDDVVEACGIAYALRALLAGPAKVIRKYEVRR